MESGGTVNGPMIGAVGLEAERHTVVALLPYGAKKLVGSPTAVTAYLGERRRRPDDGTARPPEESPEIGH